MDTEERLLKRAHIIETATRLNTLCDEALVWALDEGVITQKPTNTEEGSQQLETLANVFICSLIQAVSFDDAMTSLDIIKDMVSEIPQLYEFEEMSAQSEQVVMGVAFASAIAKVHAQNVHLTSIAMAMEEKEDHVIN